MKSAEFASITMIHVHSANPQVDPSLIHTRIIPNDWKTHISTLELLRIAKTLLRMDSGQEEPAAVEVDRHATSFHMYPNTIVFNITN